jgi:hypothetical protein
MRRVVKQLVRHLPFSVETKALWDAVERPPYLFGVLHAARQAFQEGHQAVTVTEFGVAEGYGLLALERHAMAVSKFLGIRIDVYGFDSGRGLPDFIGDHRDHPDKWRPGDYRMNVALLKAQLSPTTTLVLGDVSKMIDGLNFSAPLGFLAMDLDLYSSTAAALRILSHPRLRRTALYFDDVDEEINHRFAGELLAIDEFNEASKDVKIDRWRGIQSGRPFPEADWLRGMYLAHDIEAIGRPCLTRPPARMR